MFMFLFLPGSVLGDCILFGNCPFLLCCQLYWCTAKLCLTLCDLIDGSPPGSPVPGILQARTLEWVAISFSKAWKWKVKVKLMSRVWLFETPWTTAYQAPLSVGFSRPEYWSGLPLPFPYWCTVICNNVLWSSVFLCSVHFLFHFWFYWLGPPPFFLWVWIKVYKPRVFSRTSICLLVGEAGPEARAGHPWVGSEILVLISAHWWMELFP